MPSSSAQTSEIGFERGRRLRRTFSSQPPERPTHEILQTYYHAALAANVATWDAYLNNVVVEFFRAISNPLDTKFHSVHAISEQFARRTLNRFNTPNFENSRELLVQCTGYDPYADWHWSRRGWNVLQVKTRLNEIIRVRHSFAHGFSIPTYVWTRNAAGKARLTSTVVDDAEALLRTLVRITDRALSNYILITFSLDPQWY